MSRASMGHHVQPERRFLAHIHAHVFHMAVVFQKVLATFVDQEFGISQQVALMFDKPIAARAIDFFIADGQKNHVAIKFYLLALQHHHNHELREAFVLHVLRSATVNRSIHDFRAERRSLPMGRIAGHHIHVVEQNDRRLSKRGGVRNARPQIGSSRSIVEHPVLNVFLIEDFFEKVRRANLVAGRIRGVDPKVFPLPLHRKVGVLL